MADEALTRSDLEVLAILFNNAITEWVYVDQSASRIPQSVFAPGHWTVGAIEQLIEITLSCYYERWASYRNRDIVNYNLLIRNMRASLNYAFRAIQFSDKQVDRLIEYFTRP